MICIKLSYSICHCCPNLLLHIMDQLSCDSPNPLSGATAQAHTPFPSQALRDCV